MVKHTIVINNNEDISPIRITPLKLPPTIEIPMLQAYLTQWGRNKATIPSPTKKYCAKSEEDKDTNEDESDDVFEKRRKRKGRTPITTTTSTSSTVRCCTKETGKPKRGKRRTV